MINDYLRTRNCEISFTRQDHNACPLCKTLQYALLQYSRKAKCLRVQVDTLEALPSPYSRSTQERLESVHAELACKDFQESESLTQLEHHTLRDATIRKFLKVITDHFRVAESVYVEMRNAPSGWRQRHYHAVITHQDDMTKVDLPSFIIEASSDITRWRYVVNAHVDSVTGECVGFSHEQGGVQKPVPPILSSCYSIISYVAEEKASSSLSRTTRQWERIGLLQ